MSSMKKSTQSFIRVDGKMVVQTVTVEPLEDTGCIFIALPKGHDAKDNLHCIYKLHSVRRHQNHNAKAAYRWIGLWNSCCHHSPYSGVYGPKVDERDHPSIEKAIEWIENDTHRGGGSFKVIQTNFSKLVPDYVLTNLYREAGIKQ